MKKPKKALATLVLLGAAALVLCSSVGDKVPPRAAADTSPSDAAETPLAFRAAPPPDASAAPADEATRADERVATRARPASASATGRRRSDVSQRAGTEKAQLIHGASTAPAAASEAPTKEPATEATPARAPQPPLPKPSGLAVGQFHDQTGSSYVLSRVTCLIDGRTVYSGPGGKRLQLFESKLVPGNHTVTVQADYRIKSVGPFSYPKGFRFKVTSGRRFAVAAGRPIRVSVVGYERGGPTRAFDERLALAIRAS